MKIQITLPALLMLLFLAYTPGIAQSSNTNNAASVKGSPKVTVYYFHVDRRCETCLAVESVAKDYVAKTYKNKPVAFKSVNVDDEKNEELADKYQAAGSLLLVTCGDKTEDITADAFMYARSKPEKLKSLLKRKIAAFLK